MEVHLDFVILAAGIAIAGYFVGNGLRNSGESNLPDDYMDQFRAQGWQLMLLL